MYVYTHPAYLSIFMIMCYAKYESFLIENRTPTLGADKGAVSSLHINLELRQNKIGKINHTWLRNFH